MSNPFINTKQVEDLTTNEQALFRKYIGSNDDDGKMPTDQFPDRLDARLTVLGGAADFIDSIALKTNEIAVVDKSIRIGDNSRYGGWDIIEENVPVLPGHVPGTISLVTDKNSGNVSFSAATTNGQYGVIWWDGTISTHNSGSFASKAVDDGDAAWTNAPKRITVFPASSGESITAFTGGLNTPSVHFDAGGVGLTSLNLRGSYTRLRVRDMPLTSLAVPLNTAVEHLDISGTGPYSGEFSFDCSGSAALKTLRAVGVVGVKGPEHSFNISACHLSARAIDQFFADLGDATGTGDCFIYYGHNPGADEADASIAQAKGYEPLNAGL